MTATDKPVQRVTRDPYMVLFPTCRKKARQIVVRIDAGDILRFREKGRRAWYDLPIDEAFGLAVKCSAGFRICLVPGPRLKRRAG
jgi:hypothetical protein